MVNINVLKYIHNDTVCDLICENPENGAFLKFIFLLHGVLYRYKDHCTQDELAILMMHKFLQIGKG